MEINDKRMSMGRRCSLMNHLTFSQAESSPLHPVCEKGYTSLAKILIDNGAEMNTRNQVGTLALGVAAQCVELLQRRRSCVCVYAGG